MSLIQAFITRKMIVLLVAAALTRGVVLLLFPSVFAFEQTGTIHGSASFDQYAVNLLETGVYGLTPGEPDAILPPLYGYVLAGVYGIFGRGSLQVGVLHIVLDLISITLLADIARRLLHHRHMVRYGDWVGWLAGVFFAGYPYLIFQNLTLIDTPLFIALMHTFVWLIVLLRERSSMDSTAWGLALLAGLALGVGTLTRPVLPLLALLIPFWFIARCSLGSTIVRLLPVAGIAALTLVPWIVRNQGVYNTFVPMSVTTGSNFYQGNNPDVIPFLRVGYDPQWTAPDPGAILAADSNSPEADRERFALGVQFLRENVDLIPELAWTKFLAHWSIDIFPRLNPTVSDVPLIDYQGETTITIQPDGAIDVTGVPKGDPVTAYSGSEFSAGRFVHRYYFGALLVLSVVGWFLTLGQWREVSLLWLVQISMTIAYVIFHPSTRYRAPTDPLLFIFAAAALVWVWARLNKVE